MTKEQAYQVLVDAVNLATTKGALTYKMCLQSLQHFKQ